MECKICAETDVKRFHTCRKCDNRMCLDCLYNCIMYSGTKEPSCPFDKCTKIYDIESYKALGKIKGEECMKHHKDALLHAIKVRIATTSISDELRSKLFAESIRKAVSSFVTIERRAIKLYYYVNYIDGPLKVHNKNSMRGLKFNEAAKDKKETKNYRKFPCPVSDCSGIVDTKEWECNKCAETMCSKCGHIELKEHECKKEDIDSFTYIMNNVRWCPSCGTQIQRESGCSQMWCTICNTAFDYNTGKVVNTEHIHNPHYFEYLRNNTVARAGVARVDEARLFQCGEVYIDRNIFIRCTGITHNEMIYIDDCIRFIGDDFINTRINTRTEPMSVEKIIMSYVNGSVPQKKTIADLWLRRRKIIVRDELIEISAVLHQYVVDLLSWLQTKLDSNVKANIEFFKTCIDNAVELFNRNSKIICGANNLMTYVSIYQFGNNYRIR